MLRSADRVFTQPLCRADNGAADHRAALGDYAPRRLPYRVAHCPLVSARSAEYAAAGASSVSYAGASLAIVAKASMLAAGWTGIGECFFNGREVGGRGTSEESRVVREPHGNPKGILVELRFG